MGVQGRRLYATIVLAGVACGGKGDERPSSRDSAPRRAELPPQTSDSARLDTLTNDRVADTASAMRTMTSRQPAQPTDPTEASIQGVIETIGKAPMTMVVLRPAHGPPVRVDGPLADEVARLTGATVTLFGTAQPGSPYRTVAPTHYEIVAIDGEKPFVGVLRVEGDAVRLEGTPTLRLAGVPRALRDQAGARVYVLGSLRDGVVTVLSFGVIRAAPGR